LCESVVAQEKHHFLAYSMPKMNFISKSEHPFHKFKTIGKGSFHYTTVFPVQGITYGCLAV